MRVAFAMINCNRRDGSARAVNEVVERLADRGHEMHLYARKVEDLDLDKVRWHRVPGPGWPEVADFFSYFHLVNRMLSASTYDIIHSIGCNTQQANVFTIQNIQPAKRKILSQFQATENISILRKFTRWLYLEATSAAERKLYGKNPRKLFLPVSRGVEAELRTHYDINGQFVEIIPNAADPAVFHPISDAVRTNWREKNGTPPRDLLAIFSGGEWARKGLDLAISAVGRTPSLKLFVAGDDPDRERFQQQAVKEAPSRIFFGGFRADIATAMAAADLFLFPSRYEAFSLATIEAAACGLPIIASRINGTEDFIIEGQNGYFVPFDAEEIARTLRDLMENPDQLRRMGERACETVRDNYTWDRIAARTEAAYQRLLGL
jgi:glycosyltransferase involved in cell wall biosynthesis